MNRKGITGGIILLFLLWWPLFSQNASSGDPAAEKTFYQANFLTLYDRWEEALPLYLHLARQDSGNANLQYLTGVCYLHLPGLRGEAIPWLKRAVRDISRRYQKEFYSERKAPREAWLMLGRAYQITGDLDRAAEAYNRYKKTLKKKDNHQEADRSLRSCELARKMLKEKPDIDLVQPELLKTGDVNYHPAVSGDGRTMVYMSDTKYYHAIYFTQYADGAWHTPRNITMEIQSDGTYRVASLNYEGTLLFLTVPDKDHYNIYVSHWIHREGRWDKAVPLKGKVNTLKNEIFASLSPDGETLYFVSDRNGGQGGYDIFTARKNSEGIWDQIEPLGPPVNTPLNERSPVLTDHGKKLFFSSDGHPVMGGYDIFVSEKKNGTWSAPVNIGHPPNTTDDDLFFVPVEGGHKGYFTRYSVRAPKYAYITMAEFFSADHPRPVVVTGHLVLPQQTALPPDLQVVILHADTRDTAVVIRSIKDDGTFSTRLSPGSYTLTVSGDNLRKENRQMVVGKTESTSPLTIPLRVIRATPPATAKRWTFGPVLFAFNKCDLSAAAVRTLDSLVVVLKQMPEVTVRLEGHTDAIGSEAYNMRLSLCRARKVRDYLILHGIAGSRLSVKGYGESRPVAINRNADGTDNPQGRTLNRRTEYHFSGKGAEKIVFQQNIPAKLSVKKR
jgi:outer membrane protein OmpA-like peptidoglycan-associated protein/tetratricopeptide (TPR) repeat protein